MQEHISLADSPLGRWGGTLVVAVLFIISRYDFLLFHTLAELFGVVIAFGVFVLAWNSRHVLDNNYLLSLGIAFPFVGILFLIHGLSYKGMGIFDGGDSNLATQVWLAARLALAAAFLLAPLFLGRALNVDLLFAGWTVGTALMLLALFRWHLVPASFVEGHGLTPFKRISEYVISTAILASVIPLYWRRNHFAPEVLRLMLAAIAAAFAAGLTFTLYENVYGILNAVGHLLSILCFYLVYRALIVTGVQTPQDLLFRSLKQSERATRESEARLNLALSAGAMGAWDWDLNSGRMEWSEGHYILLGYDLGEVTPSHEAFLRQLHPQDVAGYEQAIRRAREQKIECVCEFRVIWPDGSVHWLESRGRYRYDRGDHPVRMFGVLMDITLRKKIEEERQGLLEAERAARTEFERLNRMKDEFLATVSHELRSPLSAIMGWTHLLSKGSVDTDKAVGVINHSAASLAQIVEDLLDMSRLVSGKIRLNRESVNPVEVVGNVLEGAQFAAQSKSIHIDASYAPELGSLECDPNRLQQILWNLLSNAIKFTPEGGQVFVAVSQSPNALTFTVRDTGQGIAPEFLPHLFGRFHQQDGSIARQHGGLGLGLGIVKQLVELHGGTIEAQSEGPGKGATFIVTLPRGAAVDRHTFPDVETRDSASDRPMKLDEHTLQGICVLGVDDDPYSRELLARVLSEAGATVRVVTSPAEAWGQFETFKPDVLISDVSMPQDDGYKFIRRLRSEDSSMATLPSIALTALSRPEDRRRALMLGFDEHVGKPFDPGALCLLIAHLVKGPQTTVTGSQPPSMVSDSGDLSPADSRPHILLAEDHKITAEMLAGVLEHEGYVVSKVGSLAECQAIAESKPIDLFLSDLRLTDGMSWELAGRLRSERSIPLVVMSGYSDHEYIEKSKAAGCADYLVKPIDLDELLAVIKRVLAGSPRPTAAASQSPQTGLEPPGGAMTED